MVTRVPARWKKVAYSTPMAPPPTKMAVSGKELKWTKSSEETIFSPSKGIPGIALGREPVARMVCFAERRRKPSRVAISIVPGARRHASP
jgi:hypothetical protein